MRRVGLSLLALVWHGHQRSGFAVQGGPLLMHSGAMRSKTGHEMSPSDIMTMICVFSANVLVDGGLVMPWYQPRHPVTLSLPLDLCDHITRDLPVHVGQSA